MKLTLPALPRLARKAMLSALLLAALPLLAADPGAADGGTVEWDPVQELATGPGERGPWQQNDSRFRYVDDGTAAFGSDGSLYTAWVDQASKDVWFQAFDADRKPRAAAQNIAQSGSTFSWLPRIATAPDQPGLVIVAWQEIIFAGGAHGGDILVSRSVDGGRRFSPPVNLSASVGGDGKGRINRDIWHNGSMDLAIGTGGAVHIAWTEYDGQLWHSRSQDGGATYTRPRQLAGSKARPARAPSLAVDGGRVYLAWTLGEDAGADILLARSDDHGTTFSAQRIVEKTPTYSDAPKLALDRKGVLHLAWAESNGGPFDRYRIRYARSQDRGEKFSKPVDFSPSAAGAGAAFPSLSVDDAANVLLVWEVFPSRSVRPRGLDWVLSRDGGTSFGAPAPVPGSADPQGRWNGSFQGLLMKKLALGTGGRIAVVNSALKDGDSSRVWLIRGQLPSQK